MADNGDHYFYYLDLAWDTRVAVNWSRTNNYDPTDVDTFYDPSGLTGNTDAVPVDDDYYNENFCGRGWWSEKSDGLIGYAYCLSLSGSRCQRFNVYFDNDYMGPATAANERWLACHELGHTLGLMHYPIGCMTEGVPSDQLSSHDVSQHINPNYP